MKVGKSIYSNDKLTARLAALRSVLHGQERSGQISGGAMKLTLASSHSLAVMRNG